MKLIVGLGNPGFQYHLTPHNLGFLAVDRLAEICGAELNRREAQALVARTVLEDEVVWLAKPQTYMNLSGLAVARLLEKHELRPPDLVVLTDDLDLPVGTLRIRERGTAGGHNGLKSIIGAIQSEEFVRVRMGIGPEHLVEDAASYVLRPWRKADREVVSDMLDRTLEAVRTILREGPRKAMSRYNRRVLAPPASGEEKRG